MKKDLVCGMEVSPSHSLKIIYKNENYYFCSESCHDKFEEYPQQYIETPKIEACSVHGDECDVSFKIERNGSASNVLDNEQGYKDTVFLAPNDSIKLLIKMVDYSDSTLPYMYHCHFLEHEDAGMMGQFTVE